MSRFGNYGEIEVALEDLREDLQYLRRWFDPFGIHEKAYMRAVIHWEALKVMIDVHHMRNASSFGRLEHESYWNDIAPRFEALKRCLDGITSWPDIFGTREDMHWEACTHLRTVERAVFIHCKSLMLQKEPTA